MKGSCKLCRGLTVCFSLVSFKSSYRSEILVTEEKGLLVDSIEYSEIDVVRERFGRPLLQVKDQKYGSIRRKTTKATLDIRAPFPPINDDNEEINNRKLIHYIPEPAVDEEDGAQKTFKPAAAEVTHGFPCSVTTSYQPAAGFLVNHALPPGSSHEFAPAEKQVRFDLLPPAEISSIPAPWKPVTKEDREQRIKQVRVGLDHRYNIREQQMEEDDNIWYECVDVAMDKRSSVRDAGDEVMPEIILRHSKKDGRLFQFERKPDPVPRGELGRHHMGSGVPPREVPVRKQKPVVSPFRFYQGNAVPPSARASKGKQRARPAPVAGSSHVASHPPSSPLQYRHVNPYAKQQHLANTVAGPSREAYM